MATYMYTSTTGSNWDDDDDDFDPEVYKAAAQFSASAATIDELGPLQHKSSVEDEYEVKQCTTSAASQSTVDYDVDPKFWPTYAQKMTEGWFSSDRRPAYVELSHENGFAYPHTRIKYTANWTATKLRMGAKMKLPMMMKPSPLKLSMTWDEDSEGEYIKEGGFLSPLIPSSTLVYESHSEGEQHEAHTPPDSPRVLLVDECKDQVDEYDPITGAIDLPAHSVEAMEIDLEREFVEFSHTLNDLDIEDILGDAARDVQRDCINEPSELRELASTDETESTKKTQATVELTTTTTEATPTAPPVAVTQAKDDLADYNERQAHGNKCTPTPGDSTQPTKTTIHAPNGSSPDLKYIHDPTSTSLIWNTISAGWLALSSLPWSRIAIAAAGALVEVVTFLAWS